MRRIFIASVLLFGLSVQAQAGLFDTITDGIGNLKGKISSNTSGDSKPPFACEAENKAACEAATKGGLHKEGEACADTPDANIKKAGRDVDLLSKHKSKAQDNLANMTAMESDPAFSDTPTDTQAAVITGKTFWACAVKVYGDAIEALKGPDPATFKPVIPTVKTENLDALPKARKIILSNFVVEFQQQYEKKKSGFQIMGLGNAGSSSGIMNATLPDQSTLRAITNFAYLDVMKKLKAKGYEVIEVSNLSEKSKSSYEKLTKSNPIKSGEVFDNIDGQSVLVSPDGMTSLIPNAGCTHYGSRKAGANLGNNMRQMSSGAQTQYENEIANGEGKIPLLKVWIAVEFGEIAVGGGNAFISARQNNFLGTTKTTVSNSANANATQGMFLKPEVTRFSIEMPTDAQYKNNHSCGISFSNSALTPPADGDVFIRLAEKYNDDGDSAPLKMSSQAGSVGVTDTYLGGGIGMRRVGENNDGTQAQTFDNGKGTVVTRHAANTSGIVDTGGMGTSLHTTSEWTADIRSDVYAASAATMIYKVTDAFVGKLP